ncbi:hypothetical protein AKO1_007901 [Acrasis kona]|uniref:Uncharacterized protein n=1 Tax=Acrasis kona TaxID=1008807 RepID=A0AAW2YNU4_9EUKA
MKRNEKYFLIVSASSKGNSIKAQVVDSGNEGYPTVSIEVPDDVAGELGKKFRNCIVMNVDAKRSVNAKYDGYQVSAYYHGVQNIGAIGDLKHEDVSDDSMPLWLKIVIGVVSGVAGCLALCCLGVVAVVIVVSVRRNKAKNESLNYRLMTDSEMNPTTISQ